MIRMMVTAAALACAVVAGSVTVQPARAACNPPSPNCLVEGTIEAPKASVVAECPSYSPNCIIDQCPQASGCAVEPPKVPIVACNNGNCAVDECNTGSPGCAVEPPKGPIVVACNNPTSNCAIEIPKASVVAACPGGSPSCVVDQCPSPNAGCAVEPPKASIVAECQGSDCVIDPAVVEPPTRSCCQEKDKFIPTVQEPATSLCRFPVTQ
jgi:hypothetical protein